VWYIYNSKLEMERRYERNFTFTWMCWRPHFVCLASLLVKVEFFFLPCSQIKPFMCKTFFSRWLCFTMRRPLCKKTSSLSELQGFGKKIMCLAFSTISFQNTLVWTLCVMHICVKKTPECQNQRSTGSPFFHMLGS
jgi:hypothetical protein